MWHKFPTHSSGATKTAAPLLVKGIVLRHHFQNIPITQKLNGTIDTAASRTAIPLQVALDMGLPSAGKVDGMKSFDRRINLGSYSSFKTEIYIPQLGLGWIIMSVIACERDDILLGRDVCNQNLLLVNWQSGFGMRPAKIWHRPLRLFFKRFRTEKM
jgi:hypothetical protein